MAKKKQEKVTVVSPVGLLSHVYVVRPDVGRENSSNKFSIELFVPKAVFEKDSKEMRNAVLKVAREFFQDPSLQMKDFKSPFTDMDKQDKCPDWAKGTIRIRAKAGKTGMDEAQWDQFRPTVIGPKRDSNGEFPVWPLDKVKKIKGGDFGRIIGNLYGYTQQGGGVAIGFNFLQFKEEGEAIGQGRSAQIEELDELEVTAEDVETDEYADDVEDAPPARAKSAAKKTVEPEDDSDEVDDEPPAPTRAPRKAKAVKQKEVEIEDEGDPDMSFA